eukprot:757991-Hanusia_phi.AAC.18
MERSSNDQMCSNGYDSKILNDDYFESTFGSTPVDNPNRIEAEFCSSIRSDPLSAVFRNDSTFKAQDDSSSGEAVAETLVLIDFFLRL